MANVNKGRGFAKKPSPSMTGLIRTRMKRCRASEAGFCNALAIGMVWMPGIMTNGFTRSNWTGQQLIGLDFDNKSSTGDMVENLLWPSAAVERLLSAGIVPMCHYQTYSSTADWPRFRVVIELVEIQDDPDVMEHAISLLLNLFPEADLKCKDLPRLFFGTFGEDKISRLYTRNDFHPTEMETILSLPEPVRIDCSPSPSFKISASTKYSFDYSLSRDELSSIKSDYDLLSLIQSNTGEAGIAKGNYISFHRCPICGHKDCFAFYQKTNTWACFSDSNTTGISGGTVIDYVMARNGWSLSQTLNYLSGRN